MRIYLLVGIIIFCALSAASAQYPVNDTQKDEIKAALYHVLGHGGVSEFDVEFGRDMTSPVMEVKFMPDVYGGVNADETIINATTKITQVHLDMLRKYPNLEDLELQITYWKPGLGAIISGRPMAS
jgi:hypothetical protein